VSAEASKREVQKDEHKPPKVQDVKKDKGEGKGRRDKERLSVSFATRLAKITQNVCFADLLGQKQQRRGRPLKDSEMMIMVKRRPRKNVRDSTQVT
jgi:hypothetical protein